MKLSSRWLAGRLCKHHPLHILYSPLSEWRNVCECVCVSAGRWSGHHFLCLYAGLAHCSPSMTSSAAGSTHTLTAQSWEPVQGVCAHTCESVHAFDYLCMSAGEWRADGRDSVTHVCMNLWDHCGQEVTSEYDGIQRQIVDCFYHLNFMWDIQPFAQTPVCLPKHTPTHTHTHTHIHGLVHDYWCVQ